MTFIPRSSQLGAYFACDFRAALDRARAEGVLKVEVDETPTPYAAFGTVTHYILQCVLGCKFPDGEDCRPTPEEHEIAAQLFGGRREAMETHAKAVAALAAEHMPSAPGPWYAESAWETTGITGHIDFLSADMDVIVDLKTTQRKPDHNRIKPGHIYQLMAYRKLVTERTGRSPRQGYVLYADAKNAKWALCLPFDFTSKPAQELAVTVDQYLKYLTSPELATRAIPRMGHHCAGDWCPYTGMCRDSYIPPAGVPSVAREAPAPACGEVF